MLCPGLIVLILCAPAVAHGVPSHTRNTAAGTGPYHAHLQSLLNAAVRDGLPGVSLRVKGPGADFYGAAGLADVATGEALTTEHAMYTASLGKTFTATVALQLVDEGRLRLDVPITTWLPDKLTQRIPGSDRITLRHLLSHTSGLVDYMNDETAWRVDFVRDRQHTWTHAEVVAYLYHKPLLFEPGTDYHYSNSNYVLAGLIIERVAGEPLHGLIRRRILDPAGLRHTYNGHEAMGGHRRAHGYVRRHGVIIDTFPWYSHYGLADSGMFSTPGDLAQFIEALFNSDSMLSEAMLGIMTAPSRLGRPPSEYGMGIYAQYDPWGAGQRWYAHDGIDPGYQADMMYLPALRLTIVLSANASMGRASAVYEDLIGAVVRTILCKVGQSGEPERRTPLFRKTRYQDQCYRRFRISNRRN